jgi:hypothetical protein
MYNTHIDNKGNTVEEKTVWVVWSNTDLTEGRGQNFALYYCETKATAMRLAKGKYVMGSNCPVEEHTMFLHNGHWYTPGAFIHEPNKEDLLVEQKRTAAEQAVLKAVRLGMTSEEISAIMNSSVL